jgi:dihydrolipoamide dehydrogenase
LSHYDVIVIGAGPGGYHAAERAAANGKRTLIIEKNQLGGLCLNAGCIPSKALLASAKLYDSLRTASKFGVQADNVAFDLIAARERQTRVIGQLREGVAALMERRGVQTVYGMAELIDRRTVAVNGEQHSADAIILATGARLIKPDIPGIDQAHVLNLSQALFIDQLPRTLAILGGDPLALGVAAIFMLLGVAVSIITPTLLPEYEPEIVSALRLELRRLNLVLDQPVERIEPNAVILQNGDSIPAEMVVYSAGRAPNIDGLDKIGLDIMSGYIRVDAHMRTNLPGVYAIGDLNGLSQWAHSAARMGEVAVNTICGVPDRFRAEYIPTIIYTDPEVATVGLTEAAAHRQGYTVRTARLPLAANGRFLTDYEEKRGLCKLVIDAATDRLLGAHLIAPNAGDLIGGMVAMLEDEFRARDLRDLVLPHPTMSEIFRDALMGG